MGRLIYAVAISLLVPFFAALIWHENVLSFGVAEAVAITIAGICTNRGQLPDDKLSIREGIAITGISWFLASAIAAIPFMLATDMSIADCLFEGTSGITGTGGSVVPDLSLLPDSLLLWRSLSHWIGGLGIIVIFIALFPQPGSGASHMYDAEGSGPTSDKIMPRLKSTADALLILYLALTAILIALLVICGLTPFDALNNGMSGIATGGFSNQGNSIGTFDNIPAEIVLIFFMLVGGGNFALYFMAWKKGISSLWKNTEFKVYVGIFVVITLLITLNLITMGDMDWKHSLRYAAFHTASVLTTTGFTTTDFDQWPTFSKLCLLLLMFTGGCAGSTSGGIKMSRLIMLCKMVYTFVLQKLHPRSIIHVRMNHRDIPDTVVLRVARFFFIYIMMALLLGVIVSLDGVPAIDAVAIGISTMGNAGVAFGVASSSFGVLPPISKLACCFFMVMGRLEIFTLLAMLRPEFWKKSNW